MDANNSITAAVFSAFLKCPTKAHLLTIGELAPTTFFTDIEARLSSRYKSAIRQELCIGAETAEPLDCKGLWNKGREAITRAVDCETTTYHVAPPPREPGERQSQATTPSATIVPILFSPWDKPGVSDSLLVCFGAVALSQITGILATTGTVIYGEEHRRKAVKITDYTVRTGQTIDAILATRDSREPPPLVLNSHCAVCDFQPRCRGIAIDRDDLSLLTGMTGKERAKFNSKGIFSIKHLSYTYRPRRRKRERPDTKSSKTTGKRPTLIVRNDHKLRALALNKNQVHVVGAPSIQFDGTPTFLDVEGMPDRDFYYLVGLRFESDGADVERSFWADGSDGERTIWENCLRELKAIGDAQIVSYGAYETRFLRRMKERYVLASEDAEFVDRIIGTSVNLVGRIFGRVYFPTFSNGLKEIGRYLGYEWTWPRASGAAAPLLRRTWELEADDDLKRELIGYNMDDCRAAGRVADALVRLSGGAAELDTIDVRSLEVGFQRTFGKFDALLPEFAKINNAAYWDYQRSKVYARTNKTIRRTVGKPSERRKLANVEKQVTITDHPKSCPRCHATRLWAYRRDNSHIVYDLKFTRRGIKRWAVQYHYSTYRCSECRAEMTIYSPDTRYGPNLRAFVIYLLIELRLSYQRAIEHVSSLFDVALPTSTAYDIKSATAKKYLPTYDGILRQIVKGSLIHADETRGVVIGGGHYIWVFTNLTTVAYVYAESRDSAILDDLLKGFSGVLVSDFYAAYDSVACAQQKCLIHLMRDINEDLYKNPFDENLKEIARRFGVLLREIVATVDTYGLKARNLAKHKKAAIGFVEHVGAMKCQAEAGLALQRRIVKNRDKLFTFLDYDGVPWNNNNAEHAVRAFTRLRNAIGTSTPKGHREYATLLSIQQTLRYRGMNFLEFMRSGRLEIGDRGPMTNSQ
ncbi:IS66 family transposase [Bradyrhizobium jicamae]|uniref:IS66 family transposase n=1 Tax=Bradyrhizobium jicamae TaxID=280332 RepID=A0ABS5FMH5_9BRAD|nr:IS66 family transposase [Bradyrhizobium jicamae]MBR0797983.1 IS66 family transposase [Bradyrhizobium jicamae]